MKFSAIAIIALATGAIAMPNGGGKPTKPEKPEKPDRPDKTNNNNNNNNNNQNNSCGNGQSMYCCYNEGTKKNDVTCVAFSQGGFGGICNGIQVCCNNNNGKQGCNVGNGGGKITFKQESSGSGPFLLF